MDPLRRRDGDCRRAIFNCTYKLGIFTIFGWFAAVLGKMLPLYWTGRIRGFSPAESWALGALMNTRVLMELIVVNVGFDLGFLPQRVFTMLLPRIDHSCPQDADA
ncbi:MAG TPA: hypothetical protein VNF49_14290 [Candidatus Binataceae bacterium]|nr:hypothetical protein [Candidatus Binataceae bacterium]